MNKEVSDLFIDIYQNFNIINQVEKMKQLSRKELLLLLILATDSYNEDDSIVMKNFEEFGVELQIIYDCLPDLSAASMDDFEISDIDMVELGKETGDKFIKVQNLVNSKGDKLPPPLSDEEVISKRREIGIDQIIDNQ